MSGDRSKTFAIARPFRIFIGAQSAVLFALAAVAVVRSELRANEAVLLLLFFAVLLLWANLSLNANRVLLSSQGIAIYGVGRSHRMRWTDIEDLDCSPRLISIAVRDQKSRVKVYRAGYGFAVDSFDELQEDIRAHTEQTMLRAWSSIRLPAHYRYPGLAWGAIVCYVIAFAVVLFGPLLFAVAVSGFWTEKILFIIISLGLLSPFFIRDWRRAHGTLELTPEHIEQRNGRRIVVPWEAVARMVVVEPPLVGYGWIIIEGAEGQRIRIPRWARAAGAIRHLVVNRTKVGEDYNQQPW